MNGTHHFTRLRTVQSEYGGVTGERPEGEMRVRGKRRGQVAVDHAVFVTSSCRLQAGVRASALISILGL